MFLAATAPQLRIRVAPCENQEHDCRRGKKRQLIWCTGMAVLATLY
jgi:hypothetical protein